MIEPKIVFCSFNHIYDAALHSECPYCEKIKKDQEALSKSLGTGDRVQEFSEEEFDEDKTELIEKVSSESEEATELLCKDSEDDEDSTELLQKDDAVEEDDESTELLYTVPDDECSENEQQGDTPDVRPVAGWIVCNSGEQLGRSFEILTGKNYLCMDKNHFVSVCANTIGKKVLAEISTEDVSKGAMITVTKGVTAIVNGCVVEKSVIRNYDSIIIDSMEIIFIELMKEFVKWRV